MQHTLNFIGKKPFTYRTCYAMKHCFLYVLFTLFYFLVKAQLLPGYTPFGSFNEQEITLTDDSKKVVISINAPMPLKKKRNTYLVFYALPNGNSIEWTKGKKMKAGDDWHFNIQHIAAQTRYVRKLDKKNNYIMVYLMAAQKSWPTWKRSTPDSLRIIKSIVDSISNIFYSLSPKLILNGHSGGGSFIFGFIDAVDKIPANIERIAFLDSDYGYEEGRHKKKITAWLNQSKKNKLLVLAYNDSVVIYNGKPLVSPTGGTWYRSRLLQRNLAESFDFITTTDTAFIKQEALYGRVKFILKQNPDGLIYHTEQVERNGFILSLLSGTKYDNKEHFDYFSKRLYDKWIND